MEGADEWALVPQEATLPKTKKSIVDKNGQILAHLYSLQDPVKLYYTDRKSIDAVLGTWTQAHRMVGASP